MVTFVDCNNDVLSVGDRIVYTPHSNARILVGTVLEFRKNISSYNAKHYWYEMKVKGDKNRNSGWITQQNAEYTVCKLSTLKALS